MGKNPEVPKPDPKITKPDRIGMQGRKKFQKSFKLVIQTRLGKGKGIPHRDLAAKQESGFYSESVQ